MARLIYTYLLVIGVGAVLVAIQLSRSPAYWGHFGLGCLVGVALVAAVAVMRRVRRVVSPRAAIWVDVISWVVGAAFAVVAARSTGRTEATLEGFMLAVWVGLFSQELYVATRRVLAGGELSSTA